MNVHGLLVVAVVALMVSAGAGAAATGGTNTTTADETTETETETVDYDADASYDNGTVTFVVVENASGVEGLDVDANNESVGTTDANGTVTFESNESTIEIEVTGGNVTGEFEYALENGSLTLVEGGFEYAGEGDAEARGPPTEMPEQANDRVSRIHAIINAFLDGDLDEDTTLGAALSDALAANGGPSEKGAPGDAGKPEHAGKPDDVGPSDDGDDESDADDGDAENDDADDEADGDDDDDSNGKSDDRGNRGNGRP